LNELAGTWFIVVKPDNLKWKSTSIKREASRKVQSETPFTQVVHIFDFS
jgi:hypothetical protein